MSYKLAGVFWKDDGKLDFDFYEPYFGPIGVEPVYEGELYGLSHEAAKRVYEQQVKDGWFDDYDY